LYCYPHFPWGNFRKCFQNSISTPSFLKDLKKSILLTIPLDKNRNFVPKPK